MNENACATKARSTLHSQYNGRNLVLRLSGCSAWTDIDSKYLFISVLSKYHQLQYRLYSRYIDWFDTLAPTSWMAAYFFDSRVARRRELCDGGVRDIVKHSGFDGCYIRNNRHGFWAYIPLDYLSLLHSAQNIAQIAKPRPRTRFDKAIMLFLNNTWQGRQDSNLRHPVLETGALPTELLPYEYAHTSKFYREKIAPWTLAVSHKARAYASMVQCLHP